MVLNTFLQNLLLETLNIPDYLLILPLPILFQKILFLKLNRKLGYLDVCFWSLNRYLNCRISITLYESEKYTEQ